MLTWFFSEFRYLWEKEQPTAGRSYFQYAFSLEIDREGPVCNPAIRLLGHISLDLAQPRAALEAYNETLRARLRLVGPDDDSIADVYDSIACSYTEMDDVTKAYEYLDKAKEIRLAKKSERMARTNAIYSMTHLRAGKPDLALEALKDCWRKQNLTEDQIAVSRYPKHSGDIVLLSRIHYAQGNYVSALELASKSITIRQGHFGNKGPRVADSMYLVATMLTRDQKVSVAAKLLREIVDMSQGMLEMNGHLARALWTLANLERKNGNDVGAEELRQKAKEVRGRIEGKEAPDEDTDESFEALVGYMLW